MRRPLLITLIILVLVVGLGSAGWAWFAQALRPVTTEGQPQRFEIVSGSGNAAIADQLARAGIVRSGFAFQIYIRLEGLTNHLQAGEYYLSPTQSTSEVAKILAGGKALKNEIEVTIPEGLTNAETAIILAREYQPYSELTGSAEDVRGQLEKNFMAVFDRTDQSPGTILAVGSTLSGLLAGIPTEQSLEGFLFPDTYRFFRDASPEQVTLKMLQNFDARVPASVRQTAQNSGRSFYDVLILASILEKELTTKADRQMAADLFQRRIAAGMPLQSDATVNYVTGKDALQPTLDDVAVDSPYNTYQHTGLPPGPICNPGRMAIDAALDPTPNDYWYYLTDKQGMTHFAETGAEHLANKAKYLR